MKNVLITSMIAAFALFTPSADAQEQLWVTQFGTSVNDAAQALAPDGVGGVFAWGTTDGDLMRRQSGGGDVWLARHDSAGNQLWGLQFGTREWDTAAALAPDDAGGVFAAGSTVASLGGVNPNPSASDIFLARYDSAGNRIWIRQFGATADEYAYALAPDGAGGVFVAGRAAWGNFGGPNLGKGDVILARFDKDGNQLWVTRFGTSELEWPSALAPDGAGGVMIAGTTEGSLGGPNAGINDAFLARYDGAGNQLWIHQFGTKEDDWPSAAASDGAGGVIIAGGTRGDLGGPNAGPGDVFIARYDSAGSQVWLKQFGSSQSEGASAMAPDGVGGFWLAGGTGGDLGAPIPNPGPFLAHFDGSGNQVWIRQFGATTDAATSLAADGAGSVVVAGYTRGNLGGPNAGGTDAWIARFGEATCYADCDQSTGVGVLDIFDFLCFQNSFVNAEPYACDCDTSTGNGVCDVFDFLCFQNAFVGGCP